MLINLGKRSKKCGRQNCVVGFKKCLFQFPKPVINLDKTLLAQALCVDTLQVVATGLHIDGLLLVVAAVFCILPAHCWACNRSVYCQFIVSLGAGALVWLGDGFIAGYCWISSCSVH